MGHEESDPCEMAGPDGMETRIMNIRYVRA